MCLPQMNSLSSTILSPVFGVRLSPEEQWRDFGTIIEEMARVWTEVTCQYIRHSSGSTTCGSPKQVQFAEESRLFRISGSSKDAAARVT